MISQWNITVDVEFISRYFERDNKCSGITFNERAWVYFNEDGFDPDFESALLSAVRKYDKWYKRTYVGYL